jgi:SNF2 family DNA or RNA helicase
MIAPKAGSSSIKSANLGKINLRIARNPKKDSVCDSTASSLGYKYAVFSDKEKCIGYFIAYSKAVSAAKKHSGRVVHLHGGPGQSGRTMSEIENVNSENSHQENSHSENTKTERKFRLLQNPFKPSDLKHTPTSTEEKVRESFAPGVRIHPYVSGSPLASGEKKQKIGKDGLTVRDWRGEVQYEDEEINTTWPSPDEVIIPAPSGKTYLPFQKAGIVAMSRRKNCFLADQQGLGKTIQIAGFLNLNDINKVVIICPGNAIFNWENELHQWLVDKTIKIAVYNRGNYTKRISFSPGNDKRYDLDKSNPDFDICVFPYSNFASPHLAEPIQRVLKLKKPELVIIDEVHVLKNVKSKRSMAIFGGERDPETGHKPSGIIDIFPRRIFLTGTPLVNEKIHELFHFVKALDPKGFGSRAVFEEQFFPPKGRGTKESDRYGKNLDILSIKLRERLMIRRLRRDVLDLPPATLLPISLPDTPQISAARVLEQRKIKEWMESQDIDPDRINLEDWFSSAVVDDVIRDQMEAEAEEEGENGIESVVSHVRLTEKDRKVFNEIRDEITNLQDILDNPDLSEDAKRMFKARDEAAKEAKFDKIGSGRQSIPFSVISAARVAMGHAKALSFKYSLHTIKTSLGNSVKDGKFVVFWWTHKTKEILEEQIAQMGYKPNQVVIVSGGMTNQEKQKSVELFQNDPNVKFFLGQIEASGTAITLHAANVSIFVEFDWRPGIVQQAMDRTIRIGQTSENIYECFLIAENSIDANIFNVIQRKTGVQRVIFDRVPTVKAVEKYEIGFKTDDDFNGKWSTDQRDLIQELAIKLNKHFADYTSDVEWSETRQVSAFARECTNSMYDVWVTSEYKYKKLGAKHKDFPEEKIDSILPVLWKHRTKVRSVRGAQACVNQIEWPSWVTGIEPGLFAPVRTLDTAYPFFAYLDLVTRDSVVEMNRAKREAKKDKSTAELAIAAEEMNLPNISLPGNEDYDD